jgi:hypothetical protein
MHRARDAELSRPTHSGVSSYLLMRTVSPIAAFFGFVAGLGAAEAAASRRSRSARPWRSHFQNRSDAGCNGYVTLPPERRRGADRE